MNILVRSVNWIGDAVMTMPALVALKRAHPADRITLLVRPWVAPLFEKDPHVDDIILYTEDYGGILGKFRLGARLRRYDFSTAVLFQNALDAAVIALLAGIPRRIGYKRDGRGMLLTDAVPFDDHAKSLHHIGYYLNLLEKAGIPAPYVKPWIYLTCEERWGARKKLGSLKRPVIGLNPGATYGSSKRWHPGRFAGLAHMILHELDGSVVIFGGPSETAIADEISQAMNRSLIAPNTLLNLSGRTSLRELASLISECDLLVTNDSGPMHIGYAVGTPVVAIFGSTAPGLTGPAGRGDVVIRKDIECSPCFDRECRAGDLKCMDLVSSEEVFQAVKDGIGKRRAVFLDRDGTLCRDAHYLNRLEDLEIFPSVRRLEALKRQGYLLVVVSNQSGIARGMVSEDFVRSVHNLFIHEYGFDAFYYCPHHPDDHCSCRKPEPGMLVDAGRDHHIDLRRSFVIGDKESDMLLAAAVGARGILVRTGQTRTSAYAGYVVDDLEGAVAAVLSADRGEILA